MRANAGSIPIEVYQDPSCGRCSKWIDHLQSNGFVVTVNYRSDMDAIKDQFDIPESVRSCHTAKVGRYFIEGHVPASDIIRLLVAKPDARGLAVPGMPIGSPGMEQGSARTPYEVVLFGNGQTSIFARH